MDPFKSFKKYAFRLELLQEYKVDNEKEAFETFLKTGKLDEKRNSEWHRIIKDAKARGAVMERVHVVDYPLSDYLRFEKEEYRYSRLAGEKIILIDRKNFDRLELGEEAKNDFWLFDDEVVLKVNYDKDGAWLNFEEVTDPEKVKRYVEVKEALREFL